MLAASKNQVKIRSEDCAEVGGHLLTLPLRRKGYGILDIEWAWYQTQRNLIFKINSANGFIFGSLWHFITNAADITTKCCSYFLQNATKVYYQKMGQMFYYKMRQLLKNRRLLQNASIHTFASENDIIWTLQSLGFLDISHLFTYILHYTVS